MHITLSAAVAVDVKQLRSTRVSTLTANIELVQSFNMTPARGANRGVCKEAVSHTTFCMLYAYSIQHTAYSIQHTAYSIQHMHSMHALYVAV